ncbi:MAG: helix-turn-helix transcriptional regulator [Bacteroidia bacterium]|nr:helix-turn-helix transcriptional regulator [Bacteroidia bacterium]
MKLYIKNMVSFSCKVVVKHEIEKIGLHCKSVELGEVETEEDISADQYDQIKTVLQKFGLEFLNDKKSMLVEKIKAAIVESVHYTDEPIKVKFSDYLSARLKCSYWYLAKKFLEAQGTTIEKHMISHKIERVKELLIYNELSLSEIAYKLNYSSVAHLSTQFKKVTGLTPS